MLLSLTRWHVFVCSCCSALRQRKVVQNELASIQDVGEFALADRTIALSFSKVEAILERDDVIRWMLSIASTSACHARTCFVLTPL